MAAGEVNNADSVLQGLFGSLTSAAENGRDASNMWGALRTAASDWAEGVLSVTSAEPPTAEAIASKAQELIGHVTITDMNRYVKTAGEFLRAKQNLQTLQPGGQITGQEIFNAPWSSTGGDDASPTRYRLRVLRSVSVKGFTDITREEWASYDLGISLTSIDDALAKADDAFNRAKYNSTASINATLDYELEVV